MLQREKVTRLKSYKLPNSSGTFFLIHTMPDRDLNYLKGQIAQQECKNNYKATGCQRRTS